LVKASSPSYGVYKGRLKYAWKNIRATVNPGLRRPKEGNMKWLSFLVGLIIAGIGGEIHLGRTDVSDQVCVSPVVQDER